MSVIWVVNIREEDMSHIVEISIEVLIWRKNTSFDHISKHVDTFKFGEWNILSLFLLK